MNLKNLNFKKIKLPSRNVLILFSLCLSLVIFVVAVKARYDRISSIISTADLSYSAGQVSSSDNLVDSAIQDAQITQLTATNSVANALLPGPNDTMTDTLSKSLFANYMSAQTANSGQIDDSSQTSIINNTLANVNIPSLPQAYSLSDIHSFTPRTKNDLKTYGNSLILTINQAFAGINQQITDNPAGEIPNSSIVIYKNVSLSLSKLSVPSDIVQTHLALINSYYAIYSVLNDINNYQKDPLKGLLAIQEYQALATQQNDIYTQISGYFQNNGIIFNDNEPGSAWNPAASSTSTAQTAK
ncbi:MAG: hypothetical protein PHF79_01105 [Candidatus Pacebacteria bacterium]|nr:hypothetical protein [Candidatus Paceibacterota bacterium]